MKTERLEVLKKTQITKEVKGTEPTGCCGGEPVSNKDACCKLDENKKAEGESGCGCDTEPKANSGSGCC